MTAAVEALANVIRKKFTLALLCWASGSLLTVFVFEDPTLLQYTTFCGTVSAIFGAADVLDNRNPVRRPGD